MIVTDEPQVDRSTELNWQRVVNHLIGKAARRGIRFPRTELQSLAGLAVAKARAYYDDERATCSFREWIYSQGWRLLLSEVRNELRRLARAARQVAFTDLEGASAVTAGQSPGEILPARPGQTTITLEILLEGLLPADRAIVVLRVQHWTYKQIGREYGLSGEAIRLRMLRVRQTLARQVCDHE